MRKTTTTKKKKDGKFSSLIVIGASAGGLSALIHLVKYFKISWNAPVLIVLHLSQQSVGEYIVTKLSGCTPYGCTLATEGELIKKNHIYIARPNQHLLIEDGRILMGHGPEENRWRPSIDVLFRSAALHYGSSVIGIILSGLLNDGTAGMSAIKKSGGYCMVQDPEEAEYPDMPRSVLHSIEVDACVRLIEMGPAIDKIVKLEKPASTQTVPLDVVIEANISKNVSTGYKDLKKISTQSIYSCPDCGGGLWEIADDSLNRYRCHIGHVYSEETLLLRQHETTEATLWVALRMMEERKTLMLKMLESNKSRQLQKTIHYYENRINELDTHIIHMKEILNSLHKD
jgi:two-component system chemotaxis response regulator CheB